MKEDDISTEKIGTTAVVDDLEGNEVKGTVVYARKADYNFTEILKDMEKSRIEHSR